MKLQIQNQHLRLRIDEDELAQLLAGCTIEVTTQFAEAFGMRCSLGLASALEAELTGTSENWAIRLPDVRVRDHAGRLPSREGLRFELPSGPDCAPLELLFDVDVRDSVRRRRAKPSS